MTRFSVLPASLSLLSRPPSYILLTLSGTFRAQTLGTVGNQGTKVDTTPLLNEAVAEPAQAAERGEEDMSDLPQWAKGDEEGGGNTDLEDKLVDEAKPDEPESATVEVEADEVPDRIDSGSRVLFFFRFVAALTVIMALVLIATNCYIIYKSYEDLQGDDFHERITSTTSI